MLNTSPDSLNEQTIRSYQKHTDDFIHKTASDVTGPFKTWLDLVTSYVDTTDTIFEIGSGTGRDAAYIETNGHHVVRSDATPAFIKHLQSTGKQAQFFNVLTDNFSESFRMILANAVLLHFTREEVAFIFNKIHAALPGNGYFAFTVKRGEGERWETHKMRTGRFFCYWNFEELHKLLISSGFSLVAAYNDEVPSTQNACWIRILAKKN